MDLERVIAQLHEELGLIDQAIADLERLPMRNRRVAGRLRVGRPAGSRNNGTYRKHEGREFDGEPKGPA